MDLPQVLLLLSAGLFGGFVAGLIGVGGGIIFAPVLFFYYQAVGVPAELVTPLTLGTSLFCTLLASAASAWSQQRKKAVRWRVALWAGAFSAIAVVLATRFLTTQPWYDRTAFQLVFSLVLILVIARMLTKKSNSGQPSNQESPESVPVGLYAVLGAVTGTVSASAGVGGGVVLVPIYNRIIKLPMQVATGTSSATIILISTAAVLSYAITGLGTGTPETAIGYVDFVHGSVLAAPAILTARLGVWTAHRIDATMLRWVFAIFALIVAFRMLYNVLFA